jgi:hypothetical protein
MINQKTDLRYKRDDATCHSLHEYAFWAYCVNIVKTSMKLKKMSNCHKPMGDTGAAQISQQRQFLIARNR